jgi:TolA-binding protein
MPAALLLALAQTHRAVADRVLDAAKDVDGPGSIVSRLDPATRSELKRHLLAAGEAFRRHADIVSAEDTAKYLDSRWNAADSFDLAGDMEQAKREFSLYADGAPDEDPRRPEARFRLAQVFQVERDYASAAALYRTVMTGAGAASDRARVPLARCLLADADATNDGEAEALLLTTVDGSIVGPEAAAFRESLFELGGLYYATARYPEAIARLEEAVQRYPEDPRIAILRYKLADANRLSAAQITQTLRQGLPQATREALEQERTDRLTSAAELYERVRSDLEADPARKLGELERLCLRNAYFAIGDCAFDLGDYDAAIAAYDTARLKYSDDPSSLVAMVQIVNAYVQQQQWPQARTANERARQHLARFPDEVWQRPDIPMEKKHWERWLDARTLLEQAASAEP